MKLLILSDSHRNMRYMLQAIDCEQPNLIIHLGDHETDAIHLTEKNLDIPVWNVSGNCDYGIAPQIIVEDLEGVRFFITHGHQLGVKYGLLRAELSARERDANVLLYGHTHQPHCEWHNGLWIINPGTCSGRGPVTYGVITVSEGNIRPEIKRII